MSSVVKNKRTRLHVENGRHDLKSLPFEALGKTGWGEATIPRALVSIYMSIG